MKDDVQNLKQFVDYLAETVEHLSSSRDEEFDRRFEENIGKVLNESEMRKKIDSLQDEYDRSKRYIYKLVETYKKSKSKVDNLADDLKVLTKDVEIFKPENRAILDKITVMEQNFQQLISKRSIESNELKQGREEFEASVWEKLQQLEENIELIKETIHQRPSTEQLEKLEQDSDEAAGSDESAMNEDGKIAATIYYENDIAETNIRTQFNKTETNVLKHSDMECVPQPFEIVDSQTEMLDTNEKDQIILKGTEPTHKCRYCSLPLPAIPQLRSDGVSVRCQNCKCLNILGKLKEWRKWMYMNCERNAGHFHEARLDQEKGVLQGCPICGKENKIYSANHWMAKPIDIQ